MPTRITPMFRRGLLAALGCVAAAGLVGCSGGAAAQRDAAVRANPTPELHTLSERTIDDANRMTLTVDENLRLANEDLRRLLLLDRPSRLMPWGSPH